METLSDTVFIKHTVLWGLKRYSSRALPPYSTEFRGFPGGAVAKNLPANAGPAEDVGLIPESERSPGGGNGNPLQYSCLENHMNRGAWRGTVHGVAENWDTGLSTHALHCARD